MKRATTLPLNFCKRPTVEQSLIEEIRAMARVFYRVVTLQPLIHFLNRTSTPEYRPRHRVQVLKETRRPSFSPWKRWTVAHFLSAAMITGLALGGASSSAETLLPCEMPVPIYDAMDLDSGETIVLTETPKHETGNLAAGKQVGGPAELDGPFIIPAWKQVSFSTTRGLPITKGQWVRPIVGGWKSQGIHDRNGIDLATECGRTVVAAAGGTVRIAEKGKWNGGYGNYVVIDHPNGTQTLYAHLRHILVTVGQYVDQGFPVGLIGSTGNSTGCHVHFEIRGAKNPF